MSGAQPTRRVIALAPMPPEKSAYALARYSRSPDSIEDSLRWVHGHSSEKFWDQFYFDYGHASIADLGHVIICFENISELAAIGLRTSPCGMARQNRAGIRTLHPAGGSCRIPSEGQKRKARTTAYFEVLPKSIGSYTNRSHNFFRSVNPARSR